MLHGAMPLRVFFRTLVHSWKGHILNSEYNNKNFHRDMMRLVKCERAFRLAFLFLFSVTGIYAFPSSGEAYSDRQLTLNFELTFFVCRHVSM